MNERRIPSAARGRLLLRLLRTAAIAGVAGWLLLAQVVQVFRIEGASMDPVLRPGERVLVDKLGARFGAIRRGQVVVFESPGNRGTVLVKRVVGVPGDTVRFDGESVRVASPSAGGGGTSVRVEDGTLFVLGDNRGASSDSRHFGLLPRKAVIGRVVARIAPASRIGVVR